MEQIIINRGIQIIGLLVTCNADIGLLFRNGAYLLCTRSNNSKRNKPKKLFMNTKEVDKIDPLDVGDKGIAPLQCNWSSSFTGNMAFPDTLSIPFFTQITP